MMIVEPPLFMNLRVGVCISRLVGIFSNQAEDKIFLLRGVVALEDSPSDRTQRLFWRDDLGVAGGVRCTGIDGF